jgi:very-short-patch-repair endonuclease
MALTFIVSTGGCEYRDLLVSKDQEHTKKLWASAPDPLVTMIVQPQAQIDDYRVDFLISALHLTNMAQRRLVVECDGHAFHERTKEQAARDRSRDRYLTSHDFDVFRFTGSEIWRDPWECASQITSWGVKGWV